MPFFKTIKRAFGFSDCEENDNLEEDNVFKTSERTPYINPFKKENEAKSDIATQNDNNINVSETIHENIKEEAESQLPDTLLNGILEIVNGSLPEFIRKCINIEAEKKHLYDSMGSAFQDYATKLKADAVKSCVSKAEAERESLTIKFNEMQARMQDAELKKEELNNLQLSTERQKRALTDRIHDLELANQKCEAEVEQYMLENKSLLNKLKVSQVKSDDIDFFKNESSNLKSKLSEKENELAQIEELKQNILSLQQENDALKQAKEKTIKTESELELDVAVINEMRTRIASQNQELESKSIEFADLQAKLKLSAEELEGLREELNEANTNLNVIEEIQEQLNNVEDLKKRKDAKINSLTESIKSRDIENAELRQNIISLKKTIEDNMKSYAEQLNEFTKKAIKEVAPKPKNDDVFDMTMLDDISISSEPVSPRYNSSPIKDNSITFDTTANISAIDDTHADWLVPTPPSEIEANTIAEDKNIQNTIETHKTIEDSQMSLF
ncbi:MAG: hypothetical protein RR254_07830 [Muribaculaceae bacterium]